MTGRFLFMRMGLMMLMLLSYSMLFASKNQSVRDIHIAGMIVNAGNLSPIESANVYDGDNNLLGATDQNGYFNVTIKYAKAGELFFKLKITKAGYQSSSQNEHWGNLSSNTKALMYFGLKASGSKAEAFSQMVNNFSGADLNYNTAFLNFDKVKTKHEFDSKLEEAKAGNQDVLIKVDGKLYIVDNSGWIKINSVHDSIYLNKKQGIIAGELNTTIKRKDIKWMTPLDAKPPKFAINTK